MCRMVVIFGVALMVFVSCAAPAAPGGNLLSTPTAVASGKTIYVSAPNKPMILVEPDNAGYQRAYNLLGGDGSHRVSTDRWLEVMDALGWGTPTAEDDARIEVEAARWKEQWRHWDNVNAFKDSMADVSADRVVDETEMDRICYLQQQWEAQITAARDYVQEYRRIEPDVVEKNPGLQDLEDEAERALEIVMETKQICR